MSSIHGSKKDRPRKTRNLEIQKQHTSPDHSTDQTHNDSRQEAISTPEEAGKQSNQEKTHAALEPRPAQEEDAAPDDEQTTTIIGPVRARRRPIKQEDTLELLPQKSRTAPVVADPPPIPLMPQSINSHATTHSRRRARINRILMRRRHLNQAYQEVASRIALVLTIFAAVLTLILSSGAGAAYAYYAAQLPLLDGIAQHSLSQTTRIYDRNGKLLYELYDQEKGRRTYVDYKNISPTLIDASIAAEDHTFWTNGGVDLYGIGRAAVSNIQSNGVIEGGSTITQQLIKNQFFLGQQRDFQVKSEEALLATGLTQQYPKWKIMEMYLNTVYYGDQNYGIEAAAENYFRLQPQCSRGHCKPAVAQLTLGQASLLAGLPQSPTYYNPTLNKQAALNRQAQVLQAMVALHMISQQQMQDAQEEIKQFQFKPYSDTHLVQAPHFVWYVIDQLEKEIGAQALARGGFSVYTTLDLDLEKKVEQIVYDKLYQAQQDNYIGYYGPLNITNNVNNAAVVVMNPKNGEILAMNGSANYKDNSPEVQGQYNSAVDSQRQPGSSFKPIVYATAFEMGWYPAMILPDHKTTYPSAPPYYSPRNYDGTYHTGYPMTIRTAIANSFNIPAVDAIEFAGLANVANMAERLGITEIGQIPTSQLVPSMALGSIGVSVLDMTSAYATFANQGMRIAPKYILSIQDNQGNTIYRYDEQHPQGQQVVRQDVSFLISSILSDKTARYHEFGPGNPLELDRSAAAKTGTTDSFRDNWTLGYTPYLTVGVWAGNDDNSEMENVIGITGAGPIWHDVMDYASQRYQFPADDFAPPPDVHQGRVSAFTGLLPNPGEPTITDWFIDGTMPTITSSGGYYVSPCLDQSCQAPIASTDTNQHNTGVASQFPITIPTGGTIEPTPQPTITSTPGITPTPTTDRGPNHGGKY